MKSRRIHQLLNVFFRLGSLGAKLALTLYMGKYVDLAGMGVYGLVFGVTMLAIAGLGMRVDFILSRELVGAEPATGLSRMRDQALFVTLNQVAFGLVLVAVGSVHDPDLTPKLLTYIFLLSVMESYANMTLCNMIALGHAVMANAIFFIRSGLWTIPVIGLGLWLPEYRTIDTILLGWIIGCLVSLLVTLWAWRAMPWSATFRTPVDWAWIKGAVRKSFFIWLGGMGLTGGGYVDRGVVAHYLGMDAVGIATFYSSFSFAITTLILSGVLAFAYPRLISFHRTGDNAGFWREARQAAKQVAIFAGSISLVMAIGVPILAHLLNRPKLEAESFTLWLMMFGVWIRSNAETMYYILFARHQDRAIWLGNILFLVPAFGGNLILVPLLGLPGMGYSTIIAAVFILLWRAWFVKYGKVPPVAAPSVVDHADPESLEPADA